MQSTLQIIVGSTRASEHLKVIRRNGWGRMWVGTQHPIRPFPGEPWGFDNGAYGAWRRGEPWDEDMYLRALDKALACGSDPYLAVLPDIVGAGERSLAFSLEWLASARLPRQWPWYLAVQDGMRPERVEPILAAAQPFVAGLFLGGTDDFKQTAHAWSDLAHAAGKPFHYARCGTMRKLGLARLCKADSCDSAFPIWKRERMEQFERWWKTGETQLLIPWQ